MVDIRFFSSVFLLFNLSAFNKRKTKEKKTVCITWSPVKPIQSIEPLLLYLPPLNKHL
jgi:hypothetical protein